MNYSINDIIDEAIQRFDLAYIDNNNNKGSFRHKYREKIFRFVFDNDKGLKWDKSQHMVDGKYLFSEQEKDIILHRLSADFLNDSSSEVIKKALNDYVDFVKKEREEYIARVESRTQSTNDPAIPLYSSLELKLMKIDMMISALFMEHFTPIDERKLYGDLQAYLSINRDEETPEDVALLTRLKNPEGFYYSRKDKK